MGNPTFVLLSHPIELIRANSLELVEFGIENLKVEIMSEIYPSKDEKAKIRGNERMIEVIKSFGGLIVFS
jgi:hypothetical protein